MNASSQRFPLRISEYVKDHFREEFLFEVKDVRQIKGQWYYTIEVTKDNYIHTLRFNEKGELVNEKADQAFPPDIHEEPGFDATPQ